MDILVQVPFIKIERLYEMPHTSTLENYRTTVPAGEYVFILFVNDDKEVILKLKYEEYVKLIVTGISTYGIGLPVAQ